MVLEIGDWSLEIGVWSLEIGVWSLEIGVWRLEIGFLGLAKFPTRVLIQILCKFVNLFRGRVGVSP